MIFFAKIILILICLFFSACFIALSFFSKALKDSLNDLARIIKEAQLKLLSRNKVKSPSRDILEAILGLCGAFVIKYVEFSTPKKGLFGMAHKALKYITYIGFTRKISKTLAKLRK